MCYVCVCVCERDMLFIEKLRRYVNSRVVINLISNCWVFVLGRVNIIYVFIEGKVRKGKEYFFYRGGV